MAHAEERKRETERGEGGWKLSGFLKRTLNLFSESLES